ncbi:MAG: preprotein translocase subunit SecY [Nanoarchaeota archaeon]
MEFRNFLESLPEVKNPIEKKVSFNTKLKWTLIILVSFFILANVPLYGVTQVALERFKYLAIILGTDFGSIISLGIGPIVTASIILQLLVGAKILEIDMHSDDGKKYFMGLQKLLTFVFIIFEALVYVLMKGISAAPGMAGIVIFQLCLGGLLILFMDEVVQKWGFGSGVSLFIAAGVGWRLFTALFQFIGAQGNFEAVGEVWVFVMSIINPDPTRAMIALLSIVLTGAIFLIIVWVQSLKVEIPLSFDRIRGYNIRWPLEFLYANVIPVILVAALAANMQLGASLLNNAAKPCFEIAMNNATTSGACSGFAKFAYHFRFLGVFSNDGQPISGFAAWIHAPQVVSLIIERSFRIVYLFQAIGHILFYIIFSIIFSFFWVNTSGMDAASQAKNIMQSGLNIPGFRKDERVLESILNRYITPLTIMGGATVGILASVADLLGTLIGGMAILLAVMILYQFYQNIAQQHAIDMHPALKGIFGV